MKVLHLMLPKPIKKLNTLLFFYNIPHPRYMWIEMLKPLEAKQNIGSWEYFLQGKYIGSL